MKKKILVLAAVLLLLFAGCTKQTQSPEKLPPETAAEALPETEKTPAQEAQEEKQPEAETQTEPEQTPEEEAAPEAETKTEEKPQELTGEQKRRMKIETLVDEAVIWDEKTDYDNRFIREAVRARLMEFLERNWEAGAMVSSYLEAEDGCINLYQNSLEEYICVLSHVESFQQLYICLDRYGASVFTPSLTVEEAAASEGITALLNGVRFDKRYDDVYFNDKIPAETNETFRAYAAQAEAAFLKTLTENETAWKTILDDAFRVTISFDENDQFVFELQGKTLYWLELRYMPGHGVWSEVGLWMEEDEESWELDGQMLTDGYLLSLVDGVELGMTAAPFTFESAKKLNAQQLWLCYLLLTPEATREAAFREEDGLYHVTKEMMDETLARYFKGYSLDITQIPGIDIDEETGEILAKTLSGFGGDNFPKLREKTVDGNTVTLTVDYYTEVAQTLEKTKQYTITFRKGGHTYDKSLDLTQAAE